MTQGAVISLMISAAMLWLLVYIVAHVDLIVLRRRYPALPRSYRSPCYPWFQVTGIGAMTFLIANNSPSPEMTRTVHTSTGLLIGAIGIYAVVWTTFHTKKRGFTGAAIAEVLGEGPIADPSPAAGRQTHAVSGQWAVTCRLDHTFRIRRGMRGIGATIMSLVSAHRVDLRRRLGVAGLPAGEPAGGHRSAVCRRYAVGRRAAGCIARALRHLHQHGAHGRGSHGAGLQNAYRAAGAQAAGCHR